MELSVISKHSNIRITVSMKQLYATVLVGSSELSLQLTTLH